VAEIMIVTEKVIALACNSSSGYSAERTWRKHCEEPPKSF
jgi:hypothetical protein